MEINFCITTFNRPDQLEHAVEAALASDLRPTTVTVIDNSPGHYARPLVGHLATVIELPRNIGWGQSINLAFALYDDYVICCNDDLAVHRHTVGELVGSAEDLPNAALFYGNHNGESMWALFLLRKRAFLEAGPLDPAIWPFYYDDIDILYRLRLLGYAPTTVYPATYDHIHNGVLKALNADQRALHERRFRRNEQYYVAKWGGLKFEETYTTPFNGGRPSVPPFVKET